MKWHTPLEPVTYPGQINLADHIVSLGSCFALHLGQFLAENKFTVLANPAGTLYDPLSLNRLLGHALSGTRPDRAHDVEVENTWRSLDLPATLAAGSRQGLTRKINRLMSRLQKALQQSRWLILTYGTARVYRYRPTGKPVANCQKLPASHFEAGVAEPESLVADTRKMLAALWAANPDIRVILTVSPVRHIRDGLVANSLSKAILRLVAERLSREYGQVYYYPAYEIMMDDLRDYRFYQEDLIHPSGQAVTYILDHFSRSLLDEHTRAFIARWQEVRKALQHKPFHPGTEAHRKFLQQTLARLEQLSELVDVSAEKELLQKQLHR